MMERSVSARRDALDRWQTAAMVLWLIAILFAKYTPERGELLLRNFVAPGLIALTGALIVRDGVRDFATRCMLALVVWFAVTRILNGDHYLEDNYDDVWSLGCAYLFALPMARRLAPERRTRALRAVAVTTVAAFGALAWLGIVAVIGGAPLRLPFAEGVIGVNPEDTFNPDRLNVFGMHPNTTGALFNLGLYGGLYLMFTMKRKLWRVPVALAMLGMYGGIALTDSRTAMIVTALTLGATAYLLVERMVEKPGALVRTLAAAAAFAVLTLAGYLGFGLSLEAMNGLAVRARAEEAVTVAPVETAAPVEVIEARDIGQNIADFSGRLSIIYPLVGPVLRDRPITLLIGNARLKVMRQASYRAGQLFGHWHNAFLQTLMTAGLPALLAALAFSAVLVFQCVRLFFRRSAPLAARTLVLPVAGLLLHSMLESYLFVDPDMMNLLFMFYAGFALVAAEELCGPLRKGRKAA